MEVRKMIVGGITLIMILVIGIVLSTADAETVQKWDKNTIKEHSMTARIDWTQCKGETIRVLALTFPFMDNYVKMTKEVFEPLTGINVEFELLPETELREKSELDLFLRTASYDVHFTDLMRVGKFAEAKVLESLDSYLDDPKLTDREWYKFEDFFSSGIEASSWKGKLYNMPTQISTNQLEYRKDLFMKAGLTVPRTMDDLWKCAEKLYQPQANQYGIVFRGARGEGLNMWIFPTFMHAWGVKFFDKDWRPVFNNEEGIKALEFYAGILQKFGPVGAASWDWAAVMTAMSEGSASMAVECDAVASQVQGNPEFSQTAGKWGFALVPVGPSGEEGRNPGIYTWSWAMNGMSKHKKAAWLFMEWATSSPLLTWVCTTTSYFLPSRYSSWDDPWLLSSIKEWGLLDYAKVEKQSYESIRTEYRPRIPEWTKIGDEISIAVSAAIAGALTPKEALDRARDKVYEIMETAGYYK